MLAALLGALFLFNATPAQAQSVWSATLTVDQRDSYYGCDDKDFNQDNCSAALSDNDFDYGGSTFRVDYFYWHQATDSLTIGMSKGGSALTGSQIKTELAGFTLTVAGTTLAINNSGAEDDDIGWSYSPTTDWVDNQQVSVSLTAPSTVSLSASPNPVLEGQSAELTVRLSRALSSNVTIPLTVTAGTAESGDYLVIYSSAVFPAGTLVHTGVFLFVNQDDGEDDETLTVALGTLPSPLVAGTPSSVEITITDDERLRLSVKPSHPTPACGTTVTDTCVRPGLALMLTPAPAELTETEFRVIPGGWGKEAKGAVSIRTDGHAGPAPNVTFARLRELFPGFMGYEYRLKDIPSVTARCTWTVPDDPCPEPEPPTTRTPARDDTTTDTPTTNTGGTGTGGGGGAPPRDTPSPDDDPAPDSPRCGESDREYLESFYRATVGDAWDSKEYWNSQEPLDEWFGVETDEDGEVISLRLANNNLSEDMPTEELRCLNENTELKELALWDNDDLSGEVPEELVFAVERAALRAIAEMLDLNPEWFEDYEDPFNFEDWHEGVTTDDEGRVTELDLPGEIPESIRSQFKKRREIMITTSDGGCALSPEGSSAFSLFLLTLVVFAVLVRKRAR